MRPTKLLSLFAAVAVLLLAGASPTTVSAQGFATAVMPDVIGQTVGSMGAMDQADACRSRSLAQDEAGVAAIRESAQQAMQTYFSFAASGDVRAAFSQRRNWQTWSLDGHAGNVAALEDPIARALSAQPMQLVSPEAFFFSGDRSSAAGSWTVRAGAEPDARIGYYRALFRRERQTWKLVQLEVFTSPPTSALTNYCHVPGDILSAETFPPLGAPPEGSGQVVFFRPAVFAGGALDFVMREDGTELGRLPNGRYFLNATPAGGHTYQVGRDATIRVDVEAGSTHYVQVAFVQGTWISRIELHPSDKTGFDESIPTLRSAEPVQRAE